MSIRLLEVEGFKSLKEVSWRPGDLNVVIGPNGSGKSNLLQFLELIRAAAVGNLSETIQHWGGIDAVRWDGDSYEIKLLLDVREIRSTNPRDHTQYALVLEPLGVWSVFRVTYERLKSFEHLPARTTVAILREKGYASFLDPRSEDLVPVEKGLPDEETLLSAGRFPLIPWQIDYFRDQIVEWSIYTGLDTNRDAPVRQAALTRPETLVSPDGDNLIAVLHTLYTGDRDFRNEMNSAMRAAFGESFEELIFPPASDQRVQMRVNWKHLKRSQPSAMLSDGTLRFLYLMAILANPDPPPLIAIEEPEVGLHPSMFPIIAEYAAQAAQKTQVIFTTHSADFLDAFRHAGTTPTTTVTQWRDGATHLKVLEGDELAYWLREYTLGQLFRSSELEQIG